MILAFAGVMRAILRAVNSKGNVLLRCITLETVPIVSEGFENLCIWEKYNQLQKQFLLPKDTVMPERVNLSLQLARESWEKPECLDFLLFVKLISRCLMVLLYLYVHGPCHVDVGCEIAFVIAPLPALVLALQRRVPRGVLILSAVEENILCPIPLRTTHHPRSLSFPIDGWLFVTSQAERLFDREMTRPRSFKGRSLTAVGSGT